MFNKFHSLQEAKDFINREAVAYIDQLLSLSTDIIGQNFIWHNNQAGTFGINCAPCQVHFLKNT